MSDDITCPSCGHSILHHYRGNSCFGTTGRGDTCWCRNTPEAVAFAVIRPLRRQLEHMQDQHATVEQLRNTLGRVQTLPVLWESEADEYDDMRAQEEKVRMLWGLAEHNAGRAEVARWAAAQLRNALLGEGKTNGDS